LIPAPLADPAAAARRLLELANAFEPVQDGRIYIEKINEPFLYKLKGTPAEYKAGLERAIAIGWRSTDAPASRAVVASVAAGSPSMAR
jgi:hypothetical protein